MFGTQVATAKHAINRIFNGGFYRVIHVIDEIVEVISGTDQPRTVFDTQGNDAVSNSLRVPTDRPDETAIANWYIYGASGSVDVRPKDPNNQNVPVRGLHGPTPARVTLFEAGTITFEQVITEFWGLIDRELTLSFFLGVGTGVVLLDVVAEYGTETLTLVQISSKTFPEGGQVKVHFKAPYNSTQFVLKFKFAGVSDASAYIGEAMLQLGTAVKPRFTDDLSAIERPRGTVVFALGDVPPGYILECEAEDRFFYPTAGDAQVDGIDRGNLGGSLSHDHGGRTGNRTTSTTLLHSGTSQVDHHHRHLISEAEVDPPWLKLLVVRKV